MNAAAVPAPRLPSRGFRIALIGNLVWINASEIWRYLAVVRPMIQAIFPGQPDKAPFTLPIFASWTLWDTWLILAATGFYWLYLSWAGRTVAQALAAASFLTITIFGLIWLGVFNMGLLPPDFIWTAVPLAWAEQAIAALIVRWAMGR